MHTNKPKLWMVYNKDQINLLLAVFSTNLSKMTTFWPDPLGSKGLKTFSQVERTNLVPDCACYLFRAEFHMEGAWMSCWLYISWSCRLQPRKLDLGERALGIKDRTPMKHGNCTWKLHFLAVCAALQCVQVSWLDLLQSMFSNVYSSHAAWCCKGHWYLYLCFSNDCGDNDVHGKPCLLQLAIPLRDIHCWLWMRDAARSDFEEA